MIGAAQLAGRCPTKGKVAGLIPGQGTGVGCRPGPQLGLCKKQPTDVFLPLSPSLPLSLKINKILKKKIPAS